MYKIDKWIDRWIDKYLVGDHRRAAGDPTWSSPTLNPCTHIYQCIHIYAHIHIYTYTQIDVYRFGIDTAWWSNR